MRLATYNVEWFNALFDAQGQLLADGGWSGRHDVTRAMQVEALGTVFTALDADAVLVVEAPDHKPERPTTAMLEGFATAFGLRARRAVTGFPNDTQQEIALLYDPDVITARHDPRTGPGAPRFDDTLRIDLDIDARHDRVQFSKPPLELALRTAAGRDLRLIGAHLKSKAPHGARSPADVMRIAIANRRKQLAQAIWLRRRIAAHLEAGDSLLMMGDLNDGPGLDEYESLFGRSSVEIVMGEGEEDTMLHDPHARRALSARLAAPPTTARFYIAPEGRYLQALLDYIMLSQDLAALPANWRIWHPFDDPECWSRPELRRALITASDHFPVTLDIPI
ncbi:endonuclease/exonuclease/phosphatase family protein [Pseudooceanicola aestuarii]|uniref:endonuclease/exonuclease/phosphatase family protein n=1 Tax=Pseudooceanicola aestuarii TaxID=2697319 RepID=UPI0013D165E5|nr:endonuclease/exonuclease/phosphatase family protein [Pseudooceanicola aestuarii]